MASDTMHTDMGPTALLGGYLRQAGPEGAVKLTRQLCAQLMGEPDSFHGGVWPGNVDLDVEGRAVLGAPDPTPATQRTADAVEYAAPEFFWNGSASAAGDVYSLGLLLYAGCSGGFLPFQPREGELTNKARADALRRRMKGERIDAPEGVSGELKKVIEKALAYDPEGRYITAAELLSALGRTDEALPPAAAAAPAEEPAPVEEPIPPEESVPEPEPAPAEEPAPAVVQPAAESLAYELETADAAAAGAAAAAAQADARRRAGGTRQVPVQKDFENAPRSRRSASAVPAAQRKARGSRAKPILAALLILAVLGAGGAYFALHPGAPEISQVFAPAVSPTPESLPTATAEPSPTPAPTATPRPSATPRPTPTAAPAATPAPSGGTLPASGGQSGGQTAGTGSGTAIAGGPGSSTGSYSGSNTGSYGGTAGSYGGNTGSYGGGAGSYGGSTGSYGGGSTGSAGTSTPAPTVAPASGTVTLTGDQVRVRSGPGTGYGIIGVTRRGDSLTRTGTTSNGWTQVSYNGVTAYVSTQYLTEAAPATATPAPTGTPAPAETPAPTATAEPAVTPEPTLTPAPTDAPAPAPSYTAVAEAKTYDDAKAAAGEAGLATAPTREQYAALTEALNAAGLEYAWLGLERAEDGTWTWAGGEALDESYCRWAAEDARTGAFALLHKNGEEWQLITVDAVDPAAEPYAGKLGYAIRA